LNAFVSILPGKLHPKIGSFVADFPIEQKIWISFLQKSEPIGTDDQIIFDAKGVTANGVGVFPACGQGV
jgi:hypothetical protein